MALNGRVDELEKDRDINYRKFMMLISALDEQVTEISQANKQAADKKSSEHAKWNQHLKEAGERDVQVVDYFSEILLGS